MDILGIRCILFAMNSERDLPFISIVVPVYNREGTIDKCIESLLSLDYPDYEIVFGDGGSTDGTIDLIKAAQEKDSRNPNAGKERIHDQESRHPMPLIAIVEADDHEDKEGSHRGQG